MRGGMAYLAEQLGALQSSTRTTPPGLGRISDDVRDYYVIGYVAGGTFALSGIVLRADDGVLSDALQGGDGVALTPSQALGVYKAGTQLLYAYEIYNAAAPVQAAISVWHGTERILNVEPDTLNPPQDGARRFTAAGGIRLGAQLPAGSYVLQVAARTNEPARKATQASALQCIDFEVR
jgi:hypothetical protein